MNEEISQAARKFLKWQELSPSGLSVDEMRERNENELIGIMKELIRKRESMMLR
jgi:hypothetical protein